MSRTIALVIIISTILSASAAVGSNPTPSPDGRQPDPVIAVSPPPSNSGTPYATRQDGRYIKRLEWNAPNGELPGTYEEYLTAHPPTPARFIGPASLGGPRRDAWAPRNVKTFATLSILVDTDLYPQIASALDQYRRDLIVEGYTIYVDTISGGTPAEVKDWMRIRYNCGTRGFVFIGDITAAWYEIGTDSFPGDLYYMDLDGAWTDADSDGMFDGHTAGTGDEGPEVYVGRIYAHTLNWDTEANMVNDYLAKAHDYRTGALTAPWRGLEYVEEDWYDMDVALGNIYGANVSRYDFGYFTFAQDYLDKLEQSQQFVQVCVHSWPQGHAFGRRPTESCSYANVYVYSPAARSARLRVGSDDGVRAWWNGVLRINQDRYGGWTADQFVATISVNQGWNRLLCKISQGGGDYQFSARITDSSGNLYNDLVYQVNNPATHSGDPEYIRGWLVNGFHQDISDNFWNYLSTNYLGTPEASLNPNAGDVSNGYTWTPIAAQGSCVDFVSLLGAHDYGAAYAYVRINAATLKDCQLRLGYDDGMRVWLNGKLIVDDNRYGDYSADMKVMPVRLIAGVNRMLVKVSQWAGANQFSARFTNSDGSDVTGLTYDPAKPPVSYIGNWLMNGPYANVNQATRLTTDYLGNEATVTPSEGDAAAMDVWTKAGRNGYPFDLNAYLSKDGGGVDSWGIQAADPPCLFFNLFSCGPGRFTDSDYLAGSYIFHTTMPLIAVASAKSGSMLNFGDFTYPLGQGRSIGDAYREWFDVQSPYEDWEREWYYGMVVCGDPTLRPTLQRP